MEMSGDMTTSGSREPAPLPPFSTSKSSLMQNFRRFVQLLLLFIAGGAGASAQTAYNTTLFDRLNPASGQGGRYSALTGHVDRNGREYALLGGFTGTHIIDVTEKPIRQVAFIPGP